MALPLPIPNLVVNVGEELPGQIALASQRITADGQVILVQGRYKAGKVSIVVAQGTTVDISGVQIDTSPAGAGKVEIKPSDFKITFSKPLAVAGVAISELSRNSKNSQVEVDVYESFRNLITSAIAKSVVVDTQPAESIVSQVMLERATIQMRPESTIRLAGMTMVLARDSGDATAVMFNRTTAFFKGKQGIERASGNVDLRLSCEINRSADNDVTLEVPMIEASGSASWQFKDNAFTATTEKPLGIAIKSLMATSSSNAIKLTATEGKDRFHLIAEGNWDSKSYNAGVKVQDAVVTATAAAAGGQLNFTGKADGLVAVCQNGKLQSFRTETPLGTVQATYSRIVDGNRILTINALLPKINLSLKQTSADVTVDFADLLAISTQILLTENNVEIVLLKCGNASLTTNGSSISGRIESISVRHASGANLIFSDATIDHLTVQGTGKVSCGLKEGGLPDKLKEQYGEASLTANKIVIDLEQWKPTNIELQEFALSSSLTKLEEFARKAIEKQHPIEAKSKFTSVNPVNVKLSHFVLSPAAHGIHVQMAGQITASGTLRVKSEDLASDLGRAVASAADAALKEVERQRKEAEEIAEKAAAELERARVAHQQAVEKAAKEIEEARKKAADELAAKAAEAEKQLAILRDKARREAEEAAKKVKKYFKKRFGGKTVQRGVYYITAQPDITLVEADVSITSGFELNCDLVFSVKESLNLQALTVDVRAENANVKFSSVYSDILRKTLFEAVAPALETACRNELQKGTSIQPLKENAKLAKVQVTTVEVRSANGMLVISGTIAAPLD